jgi:uncharacterized alkaline shock family protein YloU
MAQKSAKFKRKKGSDFSYKKEVVVQIIELAAKEISGVTSLSSTFGLHFRSLFSRKLKKGVAIAFTESGLVIDVYVDMLFGHSVNDVAFRVQENIKRSVESMTEFKVRRVNVHVYGVAFQQDESIYI